MVPCPESTPLPNRKGMKANRAKLLNIYLRPWTLVKQEGTAAVPFLRDLDFTPEAWNQYHDAGNPNRPQALRRLWKKTACAQPLTPVRDHRSAWKAYPGNILPASYTQVKNFLLAFYAEGKGDEVDDEALVGSKLATVTCALTAKEINETLAGFGCSNVELTAPPQPELQAKTRETAKQHRACEVRQQPQGTS